jgi:hypothetical protein
MHGNAPIEVILHIYFNFEYVKLIQYQINRPHDGTFVFNAIKTNENILPFTMLNYRSLVRTCEH